MILLSLFLFSPIVGGMFDYMTRTLLLLLHVARLDRESRLTGGFQPK